MSARTVHKSVRDMLEVHNMRACDKWFITRQGKPFFVTHRRRG